MATRLTAPLRFSVALIVLAGAWLAWRGSATNTVDTVEVARGVFEDTLTFRGEIRAVSSALVMAPSGAGELQIVKLARTGTSVRRGDVVVEFDRTEVVRRLAEKETALRQADAELRQSRAQGQLDEDASETENLKLLYEVERAKLGVGTRDVLSSYDSAKAGLTLRDAEQNLREFQARRDADRLTRTAELRALAHKRSKAAAEVDLAKRQLQSRTVRAPADGPLFLQTLTRAGANESEFRQGDRAFSGAVIAEIPNASSLYVAGRVDEVDRGRLEPGIFGHVMPDAVPALELPAKLVEFSKLALPDFGSPWPMPRYFLARFEFEGGDPRIRPGMSATIRIVLDRLQDALVLPTRAVFDMNGRSIVYVVSGRGFEARVVRTLRINRELTAIADGVTPGEYVALEDPTQQGKRDTSSLALPDAASRHELR